MQSAEVFSLRLRLEKVVKRLQTVALDCCVVEHPLDLQYLTGLALSKGVLLVHRTHTSLYVDGRYLEIAQKHPFLSVALDRTENIREFLKLHTVKKLGFDGSTTSYDRLLQLKRWRIPLISVTPVFKTMRMIKDPQEIAALEKSAMLLWQGFQWIVSHLTIGVTERALAKGFEVFCLEHGADSLSFSPIIAFGKNSAMPHYRAQYTPFQWTDHALIDIGVILDGYHSDMTRVLFHQHEDPQIRQLYAIVQRAQQKALECCRPGVKIGQIDEAARRVFCQEDVEKFCLHSLGHGIGLQIHEAPRLKWDGEDKEIVLEPGMVFTVEPGLYIPGKGGVRYEDTIVITEDGYKNFYPLKR